MIWETIFFISGSVFFLLSILIVAATGFYLLKIVSTALSIEREIKGLADDLKGKVAALSLTFAGMVALLEKFIQYKRESKKEDKEETEDGQPGNKKGPKKIKIASLDEE